MELIEILSAITVALLGGYGWIIKRTISNFSTHIKKMADGISAIERVSAVQEQILAQHANQLERTLSVLEKHDERLRQLEIFSPRATPPRGTE